MSTELRGGPSEVRSPAYPILLALSALDAAGYSLIAPVVPEISRTTEAGPALIGVLVAMFPLGIILGFPVAGRFVQRRGPEPVLVVSLAVLAIGCAGFLALDGMAAYMASRFVMGLGSGGLWMGITFATLERWPDQAYVCMSRIFAAYSIGGLLGPAFGAIGGVRGPFIGYMGLIAACGILTAMLKPPPERRPFHSDRTALALPGFRLACASILFAVVALGITEGLLPLHFGERLTQVEIAALYIAVSLVVAAAAALAGRYRPWPVVLASAAAIVAGIALAGASESLHLWIGGLAVAGAGVGAGNTGSIGILLQTVPAARIMTAMIVWSQLGIAGYLAGPLVGGLVVEAFGFRAIGIVPLVAAFALLGVRRWVQKAGPRTDRAV